MGWLNNSWVRKIPWRRKWLPTAVFLPGESHGQRSLAKELDTTEQLNWTELMYIYMSFLGGSDGKSVCLQCGRPRFDPWVEKIPWQRKWQPTPVLLPEKFLGWRNLVGYSLWGHRVRHNWGTSLSLSFHVCMFVYLQKKHFFVSTYLQKHRTVLFFIRSR